MATETLAGMFWDRVARGGDRVAQREKVHGAWVDVTWRALGEEVRELALGLLALGRRRGDSVGLLSRSRAEWVRADFAIFSAGCVTIPIYPTYPADEIAYIVGDADVRTLLVEDQEQLDKVAPLLSRMTTVDAIVVIQGEPGAGAAPGPCRVLGWAGLRALGRGRAQALGPALDEGMAVVSPEDVATIVYTSGTTGHAKGVVQTHRNHMAALAATAETGVIRPGDVHLLFLPLAHSFARLQGFMGIYFSLVTVFAESLERLADNLRESAPHFFCSVPRVFEKVYAKVLAGVAAGPPAKRRIFHWALGVGRRVSQRQRTGQALPPGLRLQHVLAQHLVFAKLQAALGGRLRYCFSGGAPLSRDIAEFFHALGILVLEGYGLTETCPILTCNRLERYKFGTVGVALPGVEIRIADDGEILGRGANIARGYHRRVEETNEVFKADGWFHTGDIGVLDAEGFLTITDRKKDLIKTASGSYVAPQHVENLLKTDALVSQALVYGDGRPYPVALITLNPEELAVFARQAGLGNKPVAELARDAAVGERIRRTVDGVNAQLASYAQVKRFAVLGEDFTQEGGELTPTLKVKRRVVSGRHAAVIDALYQS